jgi:Glycosyl hydrolases family 43
MLRLVSIFLLLVQTCFTQQPDTTRPWGNWQTWGHQPGGTYSNPILPSDYSDLDCIRVGKNCYAVSSTFQFSQGFVILQSKDLVNWSFIGHVVNDVSLICPGQVFTINSIEL